MKTYFFGSGKIGKRMLNTAKGYGMQIDGFVDNNETLWGTFCEGLRVYSPDILKNEEAIIYITCLDYKTIKAQLEEMGISGQRVIYGYNLYNNLLYEAVNAGCYSKKNYNICGGDNNNLIIDLNNGMVLGGVESWLYELSPYWKNMGYNGCYFVGDYNVSNRCDDTYPSVDVNYKEHNNLKIVIDDVVQKIVDRLPCTVICNFPYYTFWAACIVKHMYPDKIKVVAVQHSDEHIYYLGYSLWQQYIDQCLVISTRISEKLDKLGMDNSKIKQLNWEICCDPYMERKWSDTGKLRLGYAGRVTTVYKRVDNLVVIAKMLREKGIDFIINVAGEGDYLPELKKVIERNNLGQYFNILGVLERSKMSSFWQNQDIAICCSEKEGRSISISEAIANGAVTVATDVSGIRDDINDGVNGFIVPVGDMDTFVQKVEYMDKHRDMLAMMGQNAYKTILNRNRNFDKRRFWDGVLSRD